MYAESRGYSRGCRYQYRVSPIPFHQRVEVGPRPRVRAYRIGENSDAGERSAIRADEGVPIVIGEDANIGVRVTFHALKGTDLKVATGSPLRTAPCCTDPWRWVTTCESESAGWSSVATSAMTLQSARGRS